jgi:metal-responsive CopG/Arc/MetJ family transcriptional regulator
MITHTKIGISIPKELLADIDSIRKTSNRSKFLVELIRVQLQQGGSTQ